MIVAFRALAFVFVRKNFTPAPFLLPSLPPSSKEEEKEEDGEKEEKVEGGEEEEEGGGREGGRGRLLLPKGNSNSKSWTAL